jgi:hypothetical protein
MRNYLHMRVQTCYLLTEYILVSLWKERAVKITLDETLPELRSQNM